MSDKRAQAQGVLDQLLAKDAGLLAACVVSRDGLPVLTKARRPVAEETFSAMVAALMGAAEAALQEFALESPGTAMVEAASIRLGVMALDSDYLLVLVVPKAKGEAGLAQALRDAAAGLRTVLER